MIAGFDLNEKLKEKLVLECGAFEAKTIYFPDGVPLIPEKFLETIVRWDKDVDDSFLAKALQIILLHSLEIDKIAEMTPPELEFNMSHPQIVWSIFELEDGITQH
jgi:hypothetical protein